jgi:REP element-mobilizing transposase RayT
MSRKLRVEYPGAIYHVMNRGDRREPIFKDDEDRQCFLDTLGEACGKTGWQVQAYCLMPNHFHLVMETPQANLVAGMKWFLGVYTSRFNRRHKLFGHLFSGRYKSLVVDGSGNGYLKSMCDYVHLNPVRARLIAEDQRLEKYQWSSYPHYLQKPSRRPGWLRVKRLFGEWTVSVDNAAGRRRFAAEMEARRSGERDQEYKPLRRGWFLGDKTFRKELLAQMAEQRSEWHYGTELQESAEERAETIIAEELRRKRWTEKELEQRRKGDPFKVRLAARLRSETTVTLKWIAQRLHAGSRGYLAHLLYWQNRKKPKTAKRKI